MSTDPRVQQLVADWRKRRRVDIARMVLGVVGLTMVLGVVALWVAWPGIPVSQPDPSLSSTARTPAAVDESPSRERAVDCAARGFVLQSLARELGERGQPIQPVMLAMHGRAQQAAMASPGGRSAEATRTEIETGVVGYTTNSSESLLQDSIRLCRPFFDAARLEAALTALRAGS